VVARLADQIYHVLEALGESVWQRNIETNEVTFTLGVWKALGFPEDCVPTSLEEVLEYFAPDDARRVMEEVEIFLRGDATKYDTRARLRSATGEWRWLRFRGAVLERTATGEPLVVGGLMSDVSDEVAKEQKRDAANRQLSSLSARERMIVKGILAARSSKQIASEEGLSPRTVEFYRARLMRKLGISDVQALVHLATIAEWHLEDSGA
jgi:DNA-binding CsgD family transcriptional regulator